MHKKIKQLFEKCEWCRLFAGNKLQEDECSNGDETNKQRVLLGTCRGMTMASIFFRPKNLLPLCLLSSTRESFLIITSVLLLLFDLNIPLCSYCMRSAWRGRAQRRGTEEDNRAETTPWEGENFEGTERCWGEGQKDGWEAQDDWRAEVWLLHQYHPLGFGFLNDFKK